MSSNSRASAFVNFPNNIRRPHAAQPFTQFPTAAGAQRRFNQSFPQQQAESKGAKHRLNSDPSQEWAELRGAAGAHFNSARYYVARSSQNSKLARNPIARDGISLLVFDFGELGVDDLFLVASAGTRATPRGTCA